MHGHWLVCGAASCPLPATCQWSSESPSPWNQPRWFAGDAEPVPSFRKSLGSGLAGGVSPLATGWPQGWPCDPDGSIQGSPGAKEPSRSMWWNLEGQSWCCWWPGAMSWGRGEEGGGPGPAHPA